MSTIHVQATDLHHAADSLAAIEPEITTLRHGVAHHHHAAAGTRAAHGLSDLTAHWGAVLPHFADAGTGLARTLRDAANGYEATDSGIAQAAESLPVTGS